MKKMLSLVALTMALAIALTVQAIDQKRPVVDVLIADVNGDLDAFLDRMERIEVVAERLGLPATLRVFRGTFAADHNGEIVVYWELPSFVAFAEAETALHEDAEFLGILAELDAAGQGFTSELLSIEITKR